ncbi:MAG TPA: Crp/Fnr family transcriptional regulator [Bacillota bacterium]|nr:Crp/Fnr family transcriptional regulator [Bacillota bacterium]
MHQACNDGHIDANQLCVLKVPFFNHLDFEDMQRIVQMSTNKTYSKGDIIIHDGDPLDHLYIVHQGRVKIYQIFASGKEQLLRILNPGDFFGELALFTKKVMDSYAEAMEPVHICAIHREDMQQLMMKHPTIAPKILEQFAHRLEQTEKLVGQLSAKDVETRTASYLIELAKKSRSQEVVLPMSKKDLASFLGTTQETISRRLSSFQTKGWIEQQGHRYIKILDINALREVADSF